MKVSLSWLNDYVSTNDLTKEALRERFTKQSQEVEALYDLIEATGLKVGYTKSCEKHPNADKLNVCEVDVGEETTRQIICGARNVGSGQKVIVAVDGAVLPGNFKIEKAKLRGIESNGMICSLTEIGINHKFHQEEGIHVLPKDAPVGEDVLEYLHFDDTVIDLDLTPNRGDLLSMHGVAYDVGAMFDREVSIPTPEISTNNKENSVTVMTDTDACYSYYGRVLDDVTIKPSPLWMQSRLIAVGIRPISNVVDITNYVMVETGQPLHAFDFDKIGSDTILVRMAKKGETFKTLDGMKRTLNDEDILITNGETPIALGGVMGGLESEVDETTTRLFLESAVFNPANIRRTSQRLALKSESSTRYERKVDPQKTRYALDRASELFVEYASATVRNGVSKFDYHDLSTHTIELPLSKLNGVLGSQFTEEEVSDILRRLNLDFEKVDATFRVVAPTRRPDLLTYQDLVEEIGRIGDYNRLPDSLPATVSIGGLSTYQTFKRRVRRSLQGLGLDETISYSLIKEEDLNKFTSSKATSGVKVAHPISADHAVMSLTPLNGMLDVAQYNRARKQEDLSLFEIGKRYTNDLETDMLGLLLRGTYHDYRWKDTPKTDFFTLKGIVQSLGETMGIKGLTYKKATLEHYHPHQSATIHHGDKHLGHIAKLHPSVSDEYDLGDVYLCELDLEILFELTPDKGNAMVASNVYESVLKYPAVSRDIALILDEAIEAGKVKQTITKTAGKLLKSLTVFDIYTGEGVGDDKKSLALRMTFEDSEGTLKTKTIDDLIDSILNALKKEHDATLR